jgi:CheY-like chemotaxis protein
MSDEVRVVVVDDDVDSAESLAALLTLNGYSVKTAHDGCQAWALIQEFQPLCVLLDIRMPGIDGAELSRRLRASYRGNVVLIAITGAPEDDKQVAETFARVDHHIQKPIDLAKLQIVLPALR